MAEVPANWNLKKSEQLHSLQAHIKELISHITVPNTRYTSVRSTLGTRATTLITEHYAATDEDRRLRLYTNELVTKITTATAIFT